MEGGGRMINDILWAASIALLVSGTVGVLLSSRHIKPCHVDRRWFERERAGRGLS
jgi:hypothetical protein